MYVCCSSTERCHRWKAAGDGTSHIVAGNMAFYGGLAWCERHKEKGVFKRGKKTLYAPSVSQRRPEHARKYNSTTFPSPGNWISAHRSSPSLD